MTTKKAVSKIRAEEQRLIDLLQKNGYEVTFTGRVAIETANDCNYLVFQPSIALRYTSE